MLKRIFHWTGRRLLPLGCLGLLIVLLPRLVTGLYAADRLYQEPEVPAQRAAIIFGAGLRRDGIPTAMLRDRVLTGAELYFSGKVEKLIMSAPTIPATAPKPSSAWRAPCW